MHESFDVILDSQTVSRVEHVLDYSMNSMQDIAVIVSSFTLRTIEVKRS